MNALVQQESLLIGSEDAIKDGEQKKQGRLLVIADSHGNYEVVEDIIRNFGADCHALLFTGDGDRDIICCIENARKDEKLRQALPPVVALVRGNGDTEDYFLSPLQEGDSPVPVIVAQRQVVRVAGRTILLLHGQNHSVDMGVETLANAGYTVDADMIFYGHTHRPHQEDVGGTLVVNAGSCSRPRGGFPPTFAVVSFPGVTERYTVEFFRIKKVHFGDYDYSPLTIR